MYQLANQSGDWPVVQSVASLIADPVVVSLIPIEHEIQEGLLCQLQVKVCAQSTD